MTDTAPPQFANGQSHALASVDRAVDLVDLVKSRQSLDDLDVTIFIHSSCAAITLLVRPRFVCLPSNRLWRSPLGVAFDAPVGLTHLGSAFHASRHHGRSGRDHDVAGFPSKQPVGRVDDRGSKRHCARLSHLQRKSGPLYGA